MQNLFSQIRTDLALEAAESFSEKENTLSGVTVKELDNKNAHIHITHVHIKNESSDFNICQRKIVHPVDAEQ